MRARVGARVRVRFRIKVENEIDEIVGCPPFPFLSSPPLPPVLESLSHLSLSSLSPPISSLLTPRSIHGDERRKYRRRTSSCPSAHCRSCCGRSAHTGARGCSSGRSKGQTLS